MLNELTVPLHLPGDVLAVAGEYGDEAAPAEKKSFVPELQDANISCCELGKINEKLLYVGFHYLDLLSLAKLAFLASTVRIPKNGDSVSRLGDPVSLKEDPTFRMGDPVSQMELPSI